MRMLVSGDELIGYDDDDTSGDDDDDTSGDEDGDIGADELVGKRRKKRRRLPGKKFAIIDKPPTSVDEQILPVPATSMLTLTTSPPVLIRPQRLFRVKRLVLIESAAGSLINDFRIRNIPQFLQAGSVPVALFSPLAVAVGIKGDSCPGGLDISFVFSNPTGGTIVASGALIGYSVN